MAVHDAPDGSVVSPGRIQLTAGTLAAAAFGVWVVQITMSIPAVLNGLFQQDLGTTSAQLTWITAAFLLPVTLLELTFGVLGDLFGRKKLLVYGSLLMATGLLVAVLTPGPGTASGTRVLVIWTGQIICGIGAAAVLPTTLAMVAAGTHTGQARSRGLAVWSGSDLSTWAGAEQATIQRAFGAMEATFRAVEDLPIPVIAAVRGAAVGAGCQLALACDLRVVAADALIGMPTARLGILPTAAFAARLAGQTGPGRARELLYTGRLLDGPDAAAAGLAEFCVAGHELDATVGRIVAEIIRQPSDAIAATKAAFTSLHPVFDPAVRLDEAPTVLPEVMAQAVLPYLVDPR